MLTEEQLNIIYYLLAVIPLPAIRSAVEECGSAPSEVIEATSALAREVGLDPLLEDADLEGI